MRLLVGLAARNALRNGSRSVLTAATVVFGTALLTVALSWMAGVFGSMTSTAASFAGHVRIVTAPYAEREELFPLYEALPDLAGASRAAAATRGAAQVYPRILAPVTLSAGDEIGEVFGLAVGTPAAWVAEQLLREESLLDGRALRDGDKGMMIGRSLARTLGVRVGGTVLVLGQTQDGALSPIEGEVLGILTGSGAVENSVFFTLDRLQWLADLPDTATEVLVYGDDRFAAGALAASLSEQPALSALAVRPWDEVEPMRSLVSMAGLIQGMMSGLIVFICALAVWNTMMMSVLERTSEIGVLRAMGLTGRGAIALFVLEGLGIALVGGLVGVAIGSVGALYLETYGISVGERLSANTGMPVQAVLYADLDLGVCIKAVLLALATAVVGTAVPAWTAARIQPVAAMRSGR